MPESNAELAALIAQMQHEIRLLKERLAQIESAAGGISNGQFGDIRCAGWNVMDELGCVRISAATAPDGSAGLSWRDRERRLRVTIETYRDGGAGIAFRDLERKKRVVAGTLGDGSVMLPTRDLKAAASGGVPAIDVDPA
jgi:hypothetical protein